MGILPQTEPSYNKEVPYLFCSSISSSKCSAIIFLLADTTFFPELNALDTISKAASVSLINSTMVLISGLFSNSSRSVVNNSAGNERFLLASLIAIFTISRFKFLVLIISYKPWPTTPKPNSPMFNFLLITQFVAIQLFFLLHQF